MKKIAAVVVTYNREKELLKNIEMLIKQKKSFDRIYIINNNSSDNTKETVSSLNIENLKLINLEDNIGGAGGFYTGTKIAFDDGFDYIVLMDDDGRPNDENTIDYLYNYALKCPIDKIMINSLVFENENLLSFKLDDGISSVKEAHEKSKDGIIINKITPFNGTLISKELIDEIGYPNASFFIKGDETDYTNRAKDAGAFIATVVNSFYFHPSMKKNNIKRLFFTFENNLEAPWKEYYRARNYTFMRGKKNKKSIRNRMIKSFLLHDEDYRMRNKMIKRGYKDGLAKKMGKIVEPGQKVYEGK